MSAPAYRPSFLDTYRGEPGGSLRLRRRVRVAINFPGDGWHRCRYRLPSGIRHVDVMTPWFALHVSIREPVTLPPDRGGGW